MKLGSFSVRALDAGRFRLDGGAMHGVVPKTLWSRVAPADDRNRVEYATRCLLVESPTRRLLVETGNGDKWSEKEADVFAIEPGSGVASRLRAIGVEPDTIDTVIVTHLHFDHIGGATVRGPDGTLRPTFPRARHVAQRAEIRDAFHPHERNRASYRADCLAPLAEAGLWYEVEGEAEVAPGVRVLPTPGHTDGHQSVLIEGGGARVLFLGDVVPTRVHLRLPWVMAYDLLPAVTLETKRRLLDRAVREGWIVVWGHDLTVPAARLVRDAGGVVVPGEPVTL